MRPSGHRSVCGAGTAATISAPSSGSGGAMRLRLPSIPPTSPRDIPLHSFRHISRCAVWGISAANFYSYGTITLNDVFITQRYDRYHGWQIQSNDGDEYVPQAVNLYDPTGSRRKAIQRQTGDTVFIYSSSAPFNLRLNECIGYAAHVANFVPALPLTCPYINQSQLPGFFGRVPKLS